MMEECRCQMFQLELKKQSLITHAGIVAGVGYWVLHSDAPVCLFARTLKVKRLNYQHQTWYSYTL